MSSCWSFKSCFVLNSVGPAMLTGWESFAPLTCVPVEPMFWPPLQEDLVSISWLAGLSSWFFLWFFSFFLSLSLFIFSPIFFAPGKIFVLYITNSFFIPYQFYVLLPPTCICPLLQLFKFPYNSCHFLFLVHIIFVFFFKPTCFLFFPYLWSFLLLSHWCHNSLPSVGVAERFPAMFGLDTIGDYY